MAYYTLEQIPGTNKNTIDEKIERGRVNFSVNTKEVTNGWNPITIGALGNYLLDETTYYDTLQEAVDAASNGSTIKVLKAEMHN